MLKQCSLVIIIMGGMTTCTKKDKEKQGMTIDMRKDDEEH
jgi:hypothetical protein